MKFVEFLQVHRGITPPLPDRYGEWLGYNIENVNLEVGTILTSLNIRKDHLSPSGAVHGGVVSGFLDFSCGCAVFAVIAQDELCSTVDLNVKYFKPLREGEQIFAEARVLHKGRSLSSVCARLFRKDDASIDVAMATGTFNIYKIK